MLQNAKLICTSLFLFYTLINETSENQKLRKKQTTTTTTTTTKQYI